MSTPKIRLELARKLKEKRKKIGMTQEEAAEQIGVSPRYHQMLESKNPTAVKIDLIAKLAKALKTTPSKLLDF